MSGQKILIVEDNEVNLELLQEILTAHGYRVASVTDGEQVLETARKEKPDVILMDIQLPGMDGYEATRLLKADSLLGRIPVIAVTSFAMKGDKEKVLAAGCDRYVCKPIHAKTLLAQIQSLLGK